MSVYRLWREKYDLFYFKDLASSLTSFLKKYGYVLFKETNNVTLDKSLENFCWAHEWITYHEPKKHIVYSINEEYEDDYRWYCETIDTETWITFFNDVQDIGLFDNSTEGCSMKYDLPKFLWSKMNLNASKTYKKYVAIRDNYNDENWEDSDNYDE